MELAKTERTVILSRGQTTVGLAREIWTRQHTIVLGMLRALARAKK
jgi:hypothetical protein